MARAKARTARFGILEKYGIFLDVVGAEPFEKGSFPYQDASILIDVRNELVHYEPRWTSYQEEQELSTKTGHAKLADELRYRFEPSARMGRGLAIAHLLFADIGEAGSSSQSRWAA